MLNSRPPAIVHVWDALAGRTVYGPLVGRAQEFAGQAHAFHWPLEFPDVMAAGGFDAVGISWCSTGTLNLTVGCTKVSDACTNCYAEALVNRGLHGSRDFSEIKFYPQRLTDLRRFAPARGADRAKDGFCQLTVGFLASGDP